MPRKQSRYHPYQRDTSYVKPDWAKTHDWYALAGEKKEYYNPHVKKHGIAHPMRAIMVGQTGSKKTQTILDLIRIMDNFDEVHVLSPFGLNDALYALLKRMFRGQCQIYTQITPKKTKKVKKTKGDDEADEAEEEEPEEPVMPPMSAFPTDDNRQRLFIFDDVLCYPKADQKKIAEFFIAIRKCNGSCIYATQRFFETPHLARNQASHIFLLPGLKENNAQDFKSVAQRFGNMNLIERLYDKCGKQGEIFWIDCFGPKEQRYRSGFDRVLLNEESDSDSESGSE